jgi:hypothetical protein
VLASDNYVIADMLYNTALTLFYIVFGLDLKSSDTHIYTLLRIESTGRYTHHIDKRVTRVCYYIEKESRLQRIYSHLECHMLL